MFAFGEKLGRKARPGRQRDDAKTLVIVLKLYIKWTVFEEFIGDEAEHGGERL